MHMKQSHVTGAFKFSGAPFEADLSAVADGIIDFLDHYGTDALMGPAFGGIIGAGTGESRFIRLLWVSGYEKNPEGFCAELIGKLAAMNSDNDAPLAVNGFVMPPLLLTAVLEQLMPGSKFIGFSDVDKLEKYANTRIPEERRADMQKVMDMYPVRLSMHTLRQMRVSPAVAYQYMPFVEELDTAGHANTWIGQFHQGLLEQMYQNRVIFLLNMSCPVYCRFCFRKHKESRNQKNPTTADVRQAVEHVRRSPRIKEIVITGGDPFLNRSNMACAIDGLMEIPHVQTLRLATRSVAYYPHLFLADDAELLNYLKLKNLALQQRGKRMELATHFIHPDEVSPESLDIISDLVSSGIAVYIQTPFLKDCNDRGPELVRLFSLLRGAGAELHYIYIPCSPIHGNSIYWTPLNKGLDAGIYLRAHVSDRVVPRICTATPIGKMDWHTSGWAVEQDPESDHFVWLRTPYTPAYFKAFAPIAAELDVVRVNEEGTIDVRYMADIGDPSLFKGSRRKVSKKRPVTNQEALKKFKADLLQDQRQAGSVVQTGSPAIWRVHKTRVEMDLDDELEQGAAYIRAHSQITDVVLCAKKDAVEKLGRIERAIRMLREIPHVNAVRLRSLFFNYRPEKYTRAHIRRIGGLNHLTIANPLRLEIETGFLHESEVRDVHRKLARNLLNRGVTVYCNTPLLAGINAAPSEINRLAYKLRESGVEFHHLYAAGHPLQETWAEANPICISDVIDIAGRVRMDGSGREIPRYIIRTVVGEADFGLSARFSEERGAIRAKLLPYDLAYFKDMDPDFEWPDGVIPDEDGRPTVVVPGLKSDDGFMLE